MSATVNPLWLDLLPRHLLERLDATPFLTACRDGTVSSEALDLYLVQQHAEMHTQVSPVPEVQRVVLNASVQADADPARLHELSHRAEKFCVIGRALGEGVRKTVNLKVEGAQAASASKDIRPDPVGPASRE